MNALDFANLVNGIASELREQFPDAPRLNEIVEAVALKTTHVTHWEPQRMLRNINPKVGDIVTNGYVIERVVQDPKWNTNAPAIMWEGKLTSTDFILGGNWYRLVKES